MRRLTPYDVAVATANIIGFSASLWVLKKHPVEPAWTPRFYFVIPILLSLYFVLAIRSMLKPRTNNIAVLLIGSLVIALVILQVVHVQEAICFTIGVMPGSLVASFWHREFAS